MDMNNKYHIDTTPEEDLLFQDKLPEPDKAKPSTKTLFAKVFGVVLLLHIAVVSAIFLTTNSTNAAQTVSNNSTQTSSRETSNSTTESVEKQEQPIAAATPLPTPPPPPTSSVASTSEKLKPLSEDKKKEKESPPGKNNSYTKSYTVKKGDTIYTIAKRYKLNKQALLKINNITDPNKIKEGQVLQFLTK